MEAAPDESRGWSYLDVNGQAQGPFPLAYLQDLDRSGYFNPEVLFWRDGQPEWKPLKDLPDLAESLAQAAPAAAAEEGAGGAGPSGVEVDEQLAADENGGAVASQLQQPKTKAAAVQSAASAAAELAAASGSAVARKKGPVLASKPVVVAAAPAAAAEPAAEPSAGEAAEADPELAGFLAEISALEEVAGEEEGAGPASPPPDERTFVDDDGTLYVWDPALRKFMPSEQPAGYTEDDMVFAGDDEVQPAYEAPPRHGEGEDEESDEEGQEEGQQQQQQGVKKGESQGPAAASGAAGGSSNEGEENGDGGSNGGDEEGGGAAAGSKRTRQQEAGLEAARERAKKAKAAKQQQAGWFELKVNTSVYVTGLPEDVTEQEVVETFSKCGIIKEDDQRRPRVKIYRDKDSGRPKGDGLVTFLKEPSVDLAIQILDGSPFRYGLKPMSVSLAKFEQKGSDYVAKQDPRQKRAKKKVLQKLEKDLGWAGFDDILKPQQVTVVIKHMFHPDEFLQDPSYKEELEGDVTAECAKLGPVDKVRVFQHNPEGVVSVKFKTEEGADECTRVMNGRFFAGRQLEAFKWDGVTNYNVKAKESEEEQLARLEKFSKELENQEAVQT